MVNGYYHATYRLLQLDLWRVHKLLDIWTRHCLKILRKGINRVDADYDKWDALHTVQPYYLIVAALLMHSSSKSWLALHVVHVTLLSPLQSYSHTVTAHHATAKSKILTIRPSVNYNYIDVSYKAISNCMSTSKGRGDQWTMCIIILNYVKWKNNNAHGPLSGSTTG